MQSNYGGIYLPRFRHPCLAGNKNTNVCQADRTICFSLPSLAKPLKNFNPKMQGLKHVVLYLLVKETERTGSGCFEFYRDRFDVRGFNIATLELELGKEFRIKTL